jgi:hypothetical protein
MDEARRFLRYVTPGLIYAILVGLLLWIILPDYTEAKIAALANNAQLGSVLGAILLTGGLGFLFSAVHHAAHWLSQDHASDHQRFLADMAFGGVIEFRDRRTGDAVVAPGTAKDAWTALTALWYQRVTTSERIRAATERSTALSDLTHSLGTARVSSWTAIVTVVVVLGRVARIDMNWMSGIRFAVAAIIAGLAAAMFQHSYRRTGVFARAVIEEVLADALVEEKSSRKHAVLTFLRPNASDQPEGQDLKGVRSGILRRLTGWVSRTARLRAPATQPMKGVASEGRRNSSADLTVSSGAS